MSSRTIRLPGSFVAAILASIYILAFVISPYWLLPSSILIRIVILALTVGIGALWSYLSAADLQLEFNIRNWISFGVLLGALIALNYKAITSVIPWRGDEGIHISKTLDIVNRISTGQILFALTLFAAFLYTGWKKPALVLPAGLCLASLGILFFASRNPLGGLGADYFFRYPLFNYWFYALIPSLASVAISPYYEILYRVVPILSMAGLAWTFQSGLNNIQQPINLAWGFMAATVPLVFYYSSILYIEPPAMLLMLIVCFQISSLFEDDFKGLKGNPAWYALILLGFIKETTITVLLCFLVCRIIFNLLHNEKLLGALRQAASGNTLRPLGASMLEELKVIFCVLSPYAFYIALRSTLADTRGFSPDISNLLSLSSYQAIGQSFVQQYGLILICFLAGCLLLALRKQYLTVCFFLLLVLGTPFLYALDRQGQFAGYSRFNLFGMAPILAGSGVFFDKIARQSRIGVTALACILILANLLMSPVNADGTKVPLWGNYVYDTSEHYYPYRDALSWLKQNHPAQTMLFTGMYYQYAGFNFYYPQLDWYPNHTELLISTHDEQLISADNQNEAIILTGMLDEAGKNNFSVVLYQVLGKDAPQPQSTSGFHLEKVFQNDAHILVVYAKTP